MKLMKSAVIIDYKLVASFDGVKQKLLRPKYADRLDKPLAYWVVATDRRLPLAFMGTTLRELLDTRLEDLYATPGIGQKKIGTLINLLARASQPHPPGAIAPLADEADEKIVPSGKGGKRNNKGTDVDPAIVSEALWVQWRASVKEHGLENETLGRYVSSLQQLPRVIWNAPLEGYLELSLSEIRSLKTHGEKRVAAVLEVFGSLHHIVVHLGPHPQLGVRILPKFVVQLEAWVLRYLQRSGAPSAEELREHMIGPLLEQVRIDAGAQIAKLGESRLNPQGATVRQAAQRMGLTRARIYQLLGEVATITKVRWPEGAALAEKLRERMEAEGADEKALALMDAAIELFFVASEHDLPAPFQPESSAVETEDGHAAERTSANGHAARGRKENGRTNGFAGRGESGAKSNGRRSRTTVAYR